jgi:formamidopyrimidine-DNA glycosylase
VPELPDLVHLVKALAPVLPGRTVARAVVREPIVLRVLVPGQSFATALEGRTFSAVERHGPFVRFALDGGLELIVHHMLTGRIQLADAAARPLAHLCFSLDLDDGSSLRYGDEKRMGKVYLAREGSREEIPGWREQGVDILSPAFTREAFERLIAGRRDQARVFVMDQSALSAVGNAYADEILFAAGIHPKTPCSRLTGERRGRLYDAIRGVIAWGIDEVERAGRPLEDKVRDHVRVRNRLGEPCPVCGTTIRRVGVLGYDSFFCPRCQLAEGTVGGKRAIPW